MARYPRHAGSRAWLPGGRWGRLTDLDVSGLERAVTDSPGTVTRFLEVLTGEVLVADVVRQYPVTLGPDNELGTTDGGVATRRVAVLKGRTTNRAYVYAETIFVPEWLPEAAGVQLEETSDPIGRILTTHGLHPTRESLPQSEGADARPPTAGVSLDSDVVWSRAYRLRIEGLPVFAIHEWFLHSVLDALDQRRRD